MVGVIVGFRKDREAEDERTQTRVIHHIRALETEVNINHQIARSNHSLLSEIQTGLDSETDHYAVELFSNDAWDAAIHERVIEKINPKTHSELQEVYSEIQTINELVRRLRAEPLHQSLSGSESEDDDEIILDRWTLQISYWDSDTDSVENSGLGDVIKLKCNSLSIQLNSLSSDLESELDQLEDQDSNTPSSSEKPELGFNQNIYYYKR